MRPSQGHVEAGEGLHLVLLGLLRILHEGDDLLLVDVRVRLLVARELPPVEAEVGRLARLVDRVERVARHEAVPHLADELVEEVCALEVHELGAVLLEDLQHRVLLLVVLLDDLGLDEQAARALVRGLALEQERLAGEGVGDDLLLDGARFLLPVVPRTLR